MALEEVSAALFVESGFGDDGIDGELMPGSGFDVCESDPIVRPVSFSLFLPLSIRIPGIPPSRGLRISFPERIPGCTN